ncbi:PREDICTED: LOW QUALITY PROTEIN: uncharacterized protein LOC105624046 [Atta cephalotes]|uniref:Uncharacterized protein n=1 Tax=Atta cephalotes TaxID=12957 RepID=A0A158NTE5_ATTCE|nr:PREDICTED: LOW QUALITY PROTEIN: uncharacterized protein LOC105624046 [Atta cephalotes]
MRNKYAQLLEDTFIIPFAMQILIATIGMSITLLQRYLRRRNKVFYTHNVFYIGGQFILFFFSFEGQRLIDHSLQIHDKIYKYNVIAYISCILKISQIIMIVMMKSLYPSFLSAGKVYIFSLQFHYILQTSMSYFTVSSSHPFNTLLLPIQLSLNTTYCYVHTSTHRAEDKRNESRIIRPIWSYPGSGPQENHGEGSHREMRFVLWLLTSRRSDEGRNGNLNSCFAKRT